MLLVRGELLKKYPNTIVYAQRAHIFRDEHGTPDPTKEARIGHTGLKDFFSTAPPQNEPSYPPLDPLQMMKRRVLGAPSPHHPA